MPTADHGETVRAATWRAVLAWTALVLLPGSVGTPQPGSESPSTSADQMGIAVSGMGGARSALTLTYPTDPGPQKAAEDADALANSGEWTISSPKRTEEDGSVYYEAEIAPAVALDSTGTIELFPFLHVFRRFPDLAIVFVGMASGPEGDFTGSNRFLSATWHRSGTVTSYSIRIGDDSFSRPEDVALTESPITDEPLSRSGAPAKQERPVWVLWLLLVLGSAGTGVFVWGLTWWGMSLRDSRNRQREEDKAPSVAKQTSPNTAQPEEEALGPRADC